MPKNLTIAYALSAATSATAAATTGTSMFRNEVGRLVVNRNVCSSSHSDTNPDSGGSPDAARAPTSVSHATHGIVRISPPSLPRLRSPVACSTLPVARNSRLLKSA